MDLLDIKQAKNANNYVNSNLKCTPVLKYQKLGLKSYYTWQCIACPYTGTDADTL